MQGDTFSASWCARGSQDSQDPTTESPARAPIEACWPGPTALRPTHMRSAAVGWLALPAAACAASAFEDWLHKSGPPSPPIAPPGELTLQWSWFVILMGVCAINTLFCPIGLFIAVSGWIRGRKVDLLRARPAGSDPPGEYPPVCMLVPCFLPNEEGIIMGGSEG